MQAVRQARRKSRWIGFPSRWKTRVASCVVPSGCVMVRACQRASMRLARADPAGIGRVRGSGLRVLDLQGDQAPGAIHIGPGEGQDLVLAPATRIRELGDRIERARQVTRDPGEGGGLDEALAGRLREQRDLWPMGDALLVDAEPKRSVEGGEIAIDGRVRVAVGQLGGFVLLDPRGRDVEGALAGERGLENGDPIRLIAVRAALMGRVIDEQRVEQIGEEGGLLPLWRRRGLPAPHRCRHRGRGRRPAATPRPAGGSAPRTPGRRRR